MNTTHALIGILAAAFLACWFFIFWALANAPHKVSVPESDEVRGWAALSEHFRAALIVGNDLDLDADR